MIIEKAKEGKPVIDLQGPEGNAYVLLGYANRWANDLGLDSKEILADMKSGDYEHLLSVMEKHFGDYIIMYR
jgi:hypothetical protein